jgi:transposase
MPRRGEHNHHKERFWRRLLGQWQRSGLTVRDFCVQHGVSEPSFYAWRRIITQRDQGRSDPSRGGAGRSSAKPVFVPIRVMPTAPASVAPLEIVLGRGQVVRVLPGFDAATLRQLLAILEEPPC